MDSAGWWQLCLICLELCKQFPVVQLCPLDLLSIHAALDGWRHLQAQPHQDALLNSLYLELDVMTPVRPRIHPGNEKQKQYSQVGDETPEVA